MARSEPHRYNMKEVLVRNLKSVRVFAIIILVLLAIQFELGMVVNFSPNLKEVPAAGFVVLWKALAAVGGEAIVHAVLGTLLAVAAILGLVLSLGARTRHLVVTGIVAFLGTSLAAINGWLFTLSGFANDGYSHGMATGFLIAFSFYFIQVCVVSVTLRKKDQL